MDRKLFKKLTGFQIYNSLIKNVTKIGTYRSKSFYFNALFFSVVIWQGTPHPKLKPTASPWARVPGQGEDSFEWFFLFPISAHPPFSLSNDNASRNVLPQCHSQGLLWTWKFLPQHTQQRPQHVHTENWLPAKGNYSLFPRGLGRGRVGRNQDLTGNLSCL